MKRSSKTFASQKSEIYKSSCKSSQRIADKILSLDDHELEAVQIQNLKEVLNAKNASNMRSAHSKTAYGSVGKKKGSKAPKESDMGISYSLPEHAAQRWID